MGWITSYNAKNSNTKSTQICLQISDSSLYEFHMKIQIQIQIQKVHKYVLQISDSGLYECQISTTPVLSHRVWLTVAEPVTSSKKNK